jgi:hypothetical protein
MEDFVLELSLELQIMMGLRGIQLAHLNVLSPSIRIFGSVDENISTKRTYRK